MLEKSNIFVNPFGKKRDDRIGLKKMKIKEKIKQKLYPAMSMANWIYLYSIFVLLLNLFASASMGAETVAGDSTYSYLSDSIFGEHEGASGVQAQIFMQKAATILKWLLPAMNVLAITLMVISFAATIVFLSQPDFWTDVHMLKVLRNEIKDPNPAKKLLEMWRKSNGIWNFVKSMLPDVKMIAFYDAADIGDDGVPSLKTFFKYKVPKYMMIVAMIMCINDQTLLDLITRGGEAGAYLIRRGAEIDYAYQLKSFVESGKDYDPGYKMLGSDRVTKNKKILFDKIYKTLKRHNGIDDETITEEYKAAMGAKVREWVEQIAAQPPKEGETGSNGDGPKIDLSRPKMTVSVTINPTQVDTSSPGIFTKPVADLSPKKADSGYVVVQILFPEDNRGMTYHDTTDLEAWTYSNGGSITLDISKVSILSTLKDKDNLKYSVTATAKYLNSTDKGKKEIIGEATVTISGTTATITVDGASDLLGVTAAVTARNGKGIRMTNMVYTYWKNPELSSKIRGDAKQ